MENPFNLVGLFYGALSWRWLITADDWSADDGTRVTGEAGGGRGLAGLAASPAGGRGGGISLSQNGGLY